MAWMYILICSDGSYYVGSTTNLDMRLRQHQEGKGAAYTRHRLPVRLAYAVGLPSTREAFAAEKKVQGWSRAKREALMEGRLDLLPGLAKKDFRPRDSSPWSD